MNLDEIEFSAKYQTVSVSESFPVGKMKFGPYVQEVTFQIRFGSWTKVKIGSSWETTKFNEIDFTWLAKTMCGPHAFLLPKKMSIERLEEFKKDPITYKARMEAKRKRHFKRLFFTPFP